jgi:hypothetical protein
MKEIALEGLDDRAKRNALAEAALLANLSHFCIVTYRDSFTSKNHLYIVMEVSPRHAVAKSQTATFF